jgi:PAS domain S-box-containing protein
MIDKALRDGSFLFEWTHRQLDGEEFPATVLLTRMEIGGETVVKATVRDITER